MRQLAADIATDDDNEVPQVVFIEPEYSDSPVHFGFSPCDNHPPDPIGPGEHFLRDVYTALSSSPRWAHYDAASSSTTSTAASSITWPPLPVKMPVPPDALYQDAFVTTGVRVPALIASPFVRGGASYHGNLDHTSLLQLFAEKFAGDRRALLRRREPAHRPGHRERLQRAGAPGAYRRPDGPDEGGHGGAGAPGDEALINENQKALLLAGQKLLAHNRAKAIREFPELVHLQA
jgi:phospholipase C